MSDDENDDYIINAERAAKQRYLTEELIDLSYDPNLFMDFISKKKEPNIDLWTFEELQEIISQFKMKHRPGDTLDVPKAPIAAEVPQHAHKDHEIKEVPVHQPPPKAEPIINSSPPVNPLTDSKKFEPSAPVLVPEEIKQEKVSPVEEAKTETLCMKSKDIEKNPLVGCKDLKVTISEPQVTGGGIFSKKYVLYTITTEPLAWVVKRRYSDFSWLRSTLFTLHLAAYLPPIPEKKTKGNLEEKTINKRQQYLNQFITVLTKDPVLLGSSHLEQFLREPDDKKFKKYTKAQKTKRPECAFQTINLNGEAFIYHGDCSKVYDSQEKYTTLSEAITKKIKHKCSTLMESERRLSDSLKKYADSIKELQEVQNKIPNNEQNSLICSALVESLNSWSARESENVLGINSTLRIPFSYVHKEMEILKELLKERKGIYTYYRNLEAKQKPDKARDLLDKSRELYGYANYKTQREVERVLKDETDLAMKHFIEAGRKQAERVTKFHMIWGALMQKLTEMKFDKESKEPGN